MAEPVIVPVQLEVTDIDMSNANFADAEKAISKSLSGIKQSIQDAFSGIDASTINKPIEKSMVAVQKSVQTAETAFLKYREAIINAGKSTEEYKSAISEANAAIRNQQALVNELSQLGPVAAPYLAEAQKELNTLIEARNKINPVDFVDKAQPIQLEKIANAYNKVLSAMDNTNKQSEKFNQTVQDNRLTDEYNEYLKQAEAYKKKLEELDAKSKKMEALGATDKQWEALRYDTAQVSSEMDKLIAKMRDAVKTGKALRFGDGPKADLSRQINSFAMAGGNRAGNIQKRAKANESPYTEDYQKALDELDKLEKKVEAIREKSAKMVELGASQKQFQNLAYDAEQLDVKVDEVKNHLMNMVNEGGAFKFNTGDADAEIQKLRDKSGSLQSTLTGVATTAKKAQGGLTALGATHPKLAAVLNVASKIATVFGKVMKVAGKVGQVIAKGFAGAVKVISRVGSAVGRVSSGFVNLGKRIFSSIKNMNLFGKSGKKTTTDMNARFKKLTRNFLMFGLGFRTMYYAIKRLRTIFVESFKVMGDTFDEVGQPMMRMMESFNRLKGSLATAFQPLVSVVMPILTRFMNYMSDVLESIGKFMATLTGQGHIYKAVAKDINSVAGAAKNANKQLGSYDKLEVIQDNNSTGVDYEKQTISETESAASSFAQMVKEAWEKADFTSVGQYVTTQLLEVLDKVETTLVPKVTGLVNNVLKSINSFLTGFDAEAIGEKVGSIVNTIVNGIDWAQLGALFANLYNTIWGFFAGLVDGIDWANLGISLATGITSLFNTIDFASWADMISGLANGLFTMLDNVLTNVDWTTVATNLGTAIVNLFNNLDTEQIGTTINTLFDTIWTLIGTFFDTVDWETVATKIADGINSIFDGDSTAFDEAMPKVAEGFVTFFTTAIEEINWDDILNTLLDGLQTVLDSLGEEMEKSDNPIISGFGSVISALSEAIEILRPAIESIIEAIGPIINAILPVISALLPPIAQIISTAVQMVMPVLVKLFEAIMPILGELMEILLPILLDLLESLQPVFDALVDVVLPVIVHLLDALMPLIRGVLKLIGNLLAPILSLIGPLLEIVFKIIDPIITLLEPLFTIIGSLCEVLGDILRPILDALTPILEAISSVFDLLSPIISLLISPLTKMADKFKFVSGIVSGTLTPVLKALKAGIEGITSVVKMISGAFSTAFGALKKIVDDAWAAIKKPLNAMLAGLESIANGFIRMLNTMIKGINKIGFDIPNWGIFGDLAGKRFGFNIKEISEIKIPRLAQGAVIPPNKEFLAMLGDQKNGTNIEAPLDTIKQALAEVLAEVGGGNREPIVLQVNGRVLAKVVWDEQEKRYKQTGQYAMA